MIELQDLPPEVRLLLAEVELGLDVEQFMQSKVGRYLVGRAMHEADQATEQLKTADPENSKEIRRLQNEIYRSNQVIEWLNEALQAGKNAEEQIHQNEARSGEE